MTPSKQVVLITGATSGIGEAIATFLHKKGHKVYGTGRGEPSIHKNGYEVLQLNINKTETVKKAIETLISKEGRIDVLVNNAGIGLAGAVEETTEEDVAMIFDTNVIGLHRTCNAVLPYMRKQKQGKIINIGSMAGMIGLPFRAYYSASKYAAEGFSEALSMEVKQFGVKVILIQPGDVKTKINENRVETQSSTDSPYNKSYTYVKNIFSNAVDSAFEPIEIAKITHKIILKKNPSFRYKKGSFFENFSHIVKKITPFRWFETFVTMYYKMNKLL